MSPLPELSTMKARTPFNKMMVLGALLVALAVLRFGVLQ